jgi:hypothetical protein
MRQGEERQELQSVVKGIDSAEGMDISAISLNKLNGRLDVSVSLNAEADRERHSVIFVDLAEALREHKDSRVSVSVSGKYYESSLSYGDGYDGLGDMDNEEFREWVLSERFHQER